MIAIVDPIAHRRAFANRRDATHMLLQKAACGRRHGANAGRGNFGTSNATGASRTQTHSHKRRQPLCRKPARARSPSHHRITAHA
ncbi:MAG: hypothetical protein NW204_05175 [Xanthomonadaceae bacterium]|nr:hypothetical protein [Xanthomonadaceae bacterium]